MFVITSCYYYYANFQQFISLWQIICLLGQLDLTKKKKKEIRIIACCELLTYKITRTIETRISKGKKSANFGTRVVRPSTELSTSSNPINFLR